VSDRIIVCRCEDVGEDDVVQAIALGCADLEEVKRYTGFGTGPCQGKECLATIAGLIAERTGRAPIRIAPFTARPPLEPVTLGVLAGGAAGASPEPTGGSELAEVRIDR
jgi:bacterioferritin-associated ferredoxin